MFRGANRVDKAKGARWRPPINPLHVIASKSGAAGCPFRLAFQPLTDFIRTPSKLKTTHSCKAGSSRRYRDRSFVWIWQACLGKITGSLSVSIEPPLLGFPYSDGPTSHSTDIASNLLTLTQQS
jgi:hypothetical protein